MYFANEDEWSAKVVNCIRTNGASCAKTSNTNQRTLATEHGKELFLNPDSIGMSIEQSANSLQMLDDFGVRLENGETKPKGILKEGNYGEMKMDDSYESRGIHG